MTRNPDKLGAKLGPRLVDLLTRAQLAVKAQSRADDARHTLRVAELFGQLGFAQSKDAYRQLMQQIIEHPDAPPYMRVFFERVASQGQLWLDVVRYVSLFVSSLTVVRDLGALLAEPMMRDIRRKFTAERGQTLPIDPSVWASLFVRGRRRQDHAQHEVASVGIGETAFYALADASDNPPAVGQILDALNREIIDEARARELLKDTGLRDDAIEEVLRLRHQVLGPELLGEMVVRGIIDADEGARLAERAGVRERDFERIVLQSGGPPGAQELLFAYRRGQIDRGRLHRGLRQSRLRNEWIDVVEDLRYVPMSAEAAIQAAVENHISVDEARTIVAQNGIRPEDFDALLETAGNPPGVGDLTEAWNREQITEAEFEQGLRESRLKNKWIPVLKRLRRRVPPLRSVTGMVRRGVIDARQGIEYLLDLGYTRVVAEQLVGEAQAGKTGGDKDLAKGEVLQLYQDRALSRADATAFFVEVGYDTDEAAFILDIADLRRLRKFTESAIGRIRTLFVGHKIDEGAASSALDSLRVPVEQRDDLVELWSLERAANVRALTGPQIWTGAKRGIITRDEAGAMLQQLGYTPDDAEYLLLLAGVPS